MAVSRGTEVFTVTWLAVDFVLVIRARAEVENFAAAAAFEASLMPALMVELHLLVHIHRLATDRAFCTSTERHFFKQHEQETSDRV